MAQPECGSDALLLTFHEPTLAAVGKTVAGMGGGGRGTKGRDGPGRVQGAADGQSPHKCVDPAPSLGTFRQGSSPPRPGEGGLELNVESIFSSHLHCTLSKCEGTA